MPSRKEYLAGSVPYGRVRKVELPEMIDTMEQKDNFTIEELRAAVSAAVNAALDARDGGKKNTLLSRDTVAKRLHVDVSTLWRWNRSGFLRAHKIGRRTWYSEESVEKLERGEIDV